MNIFVNLHDLGGFRFAEVIVKFLSLRTGNLSVWPSITSDWVGQSHWYELVGAGYWK